MFMSFMSHRLLAVCEIAVFEIGVQISIPRQFTLKSFSAAFIAVSVIPCIVIDHVSVFKYTQ